MLVLPHDLVTWTAIASVLVAVLSLLVAFYLNRLYGTGLSTCWLVIIMSLFTFTISVSLENTSDLLKAAGDVSLIVGGIAMFAARGWLRQAFEEAGPDDC